MSESDGWFVRLTVKAERVLLIGERIVLLLGSVLSVAHLVTVGWPWYRSLPTATAVPVHVVVDILLLFMASRALREWNKSREQDDDGQEEEADEAPQ